MRSLLVEARKLKNQGRYEEANVLCVAILGELSKLERTRSLRGGLTGASIGLLLGLLFVPPLCWLPLVVGATTGQKTASYLNKSINDIRTECYTIKNTIGEIWCED